jgi:hypothetical protein
MSRRRARRGLLARIFTNRANPRSRWITASDVWTNTKEILYSWANRVPSNSYIRYQNGRIVGHTVRYRR